MTIARRFVALTILLFSFVLAPVNVAHPAPTAPPTVSGFWPGDTPSSTLVFVFGSNFDATFGGTKVAINGISAPIVQVLDKDLLVFMLPAGDTAGPITVTTAAGTATSSAKFGPDPAPVAVNGFWPTEAVPGSVVFVFGKGLVPGSTKVKLNGQDTPIMQVLDSGLLFFMVPPDATTGTITVTTPAGVVVTIDLLAVRRPGPVTLIHTGDIHGHLIPRDNVRSDSTGRPEGGLARVYTKIQEIRGRSVGANLYFNTGDTLQGSAEALFTRGQAMIDVINLFGVQAHAPGNWDFLYGPQRFLETFVGNGATPPLAPWNALAANLYYSTVAEDPTTPFPDKGGQHVLPPYKIVWVGKFKIGVLGFTTQRGIAIVGPSVTKGFKFTSGDTELPYYIDLLRNKEKVDLVVMISELELANGVRLAEKFPGVDVVLSADMHEKTLKPIVTSTGTLLVEEGQDGIMVGEIRVNIASGKMQSWSWTPHIITDRIAENAAVAKKVAEVRKPFLASSFVPNQQATVGGNTTTLKRAVDKVVGYAAIDLHRSNFSHEDMPAAVEGSSHDFISDAMKWATGADFAAIRGFRYGTHIKAGNPIYMGDLYHYMPLAARVAKAYPVYGKQLKDQVENSTRSVFDIDPTQWRGGWMFGYSGITYDLDVYQPYYSRGSNIKVSGTLIPDTTAVNSTLYPAAKLDGSQQVPVNASTATGTATGRYDTVTKKLDVTINVKGIYITDLLNSHIHVGAPGANGAIVIGLGTTGWVATADGMSFTAKGLLLPVANEKDFLRGHTYFNLHTTAYPGGEIRGQISTALTAALDGAQQVPANTSTATGTAIGGYDTATKKIDVTINVKGISPANLIGAHIHVGAAGSNGVIIVNLGTAGWVATTDGMSFTAEGLLLPAVNEKDFLNGNTYFNLHTTAYPGGEIRGQIHISLPPQYAAAGYWFADDPGTINNCGACSNPGGKVEPLVDENGDPLDVTEIVVRYLQSLPGQTANPTLHRINLLKPLPPARYGFPELQPLKGGQP